jgi:hypothetical protein
VREREKERERKRDRDRETGSIEEKEKESFQKEGEWTFPLNMVRTSPGRIAVPDGMFSTNGMYTLKSTLPRGRH